VIDRDEIRRKAQEAFEARWREGDPWSVAGSALDRASYEFQLAWLSDRRYRRALELGCGGGQFTRLLTDLADHVLAVDVAPSAIARARAAAPPGASVDFRAVDAMEFDVAAEGPFDLVVLSETMYCLGWLYPLFELGVLVCELHSATAPGGRFLMANTYGNESDWLLRPWLIDTYRDLVANVGYAIEREEVMEGTKDGVGFRILVTLFCKP
jgi:SAM-dependent methyltransferase